MRFLAFVALLISLAAVGWAGQVLWQEVQARDDVVVERQAAAQEAEPQPPTQTSPLRTWPALFGELQPPAPPEPQPPKQQEEPQPPPKKFPPLASKGYVLQGTVSAGEVTWALVSHPTGARVLRVGDALEEGLPIIRIDANGLWAQPVGGDEMLLEWPE
jgi:hypothetical protein